MMRSLSRTLSTALLAGAVTVAVPLRAQETTTGASDFRWDGAIAAGKTLYLRSMNGPVRVVAASGDRAEIVAYKRAGRGDPNEVRITAERINGGADGDVLVCAVWNDRTRCDADGYNTRRDDEDGWTRRRNDVSVRFEVRLPKGVHLVTSTVNGEIEVEGATASVDAHTVNGSVQAVSSGGPVMASTVNGSLTARMRRLGDGDLRYETVNGSVTVEVSELGDAELDMRTVNGRVETDFPVTIQGTLRRNALRGTIGKGGREIELKTVNGSVRLRKAGA